MVTLGTLLMIVAAPSALILMLIIVFGTKE